MTDECEHLAEYVIDRLNAGAKPDDLADALAAFEFVLLDDEPETIH